MWHTNEPTITGVDLCHKKLEIRDSESLVAGFQNEHSYDCYELDGPGVKSRWERYVSHPPRPALGPTHSHIQWTSGLFSRGYSGQGVVLTIRLI